MAEAAHPQAEPDESRNDGTLESAVSSISSLLESEEPTEETPSEATPEEGEAPATPDEKPAAEAPAGEEPFTLQKLAETIGAENADELATMVQVEGPDGKTLPLAEALKAWRAGAPDAAQQALAVQQIQQQRQIEGAQYQEAMMRVHALSQELFRQIDGEERQVDWARLREENPNEYLLKRTALEDRRRVAGQALVEMRAAQERAQQEHGQQLEQFKQAHMAMLLDAKPEWRDPAKAREDVGKLRQHLVSSGWQEAEVDNLVDHRLIVALWKAYQYDTVRASTKKKITELKKLPKMVTPGARREPSEVSTEERRKRWTRLEKTGSARDAAALIEGMI